jgi:hypothetical protein
MTALNAPSTEASGWWRSTRAGPTRRYPFEPAVADVVERHPRAERDRREDGHLGRGVRPREVVRRIGLREAAPLRLLERLRQGRPGLHLGEDEVRRAVHDPEDAVHVRRHERLPQRLDHGDRSAHGRLEAQLDTRRGRGREELGPSAGDELLVRSDDGLAGGEQVEHERSGRLETSHHLGHDGDLRVVPDRCRLGREHPRARLEAALLARVAHERPDDPEPVPGRALDVVGVLYEQTVDCGADRPVPEEADSDIGPSCQRSPPRPRAA